MIYERKSSRELVMPYEAFKGLGFNRVCKMLGIVPRRPQGGPRR